MRIAVIIAFRGDPSLLLWTLDGFAQQQLDPADTLDIHVGLDGQTPTLPPLPSNIHMHPFPRSGAAAIRNELIARTDADTLILGNADARPAPDMVRIHARTLAAQPPRTLVLGSAPWEKPAAPTVFDALLADTPMIFFYNSLTPHTHLDFRHAWTLNLSARRADILSAGGFDSRLRPVYYEDLALGHALLGPTAKGIFYEPAARVLHRHPTTLEQYLNREELLGLMSPVLAKYQPHVFAALHANRSVDALAVDYRTWVTLDLPSHRWVYDRLLAWATLPESTLSQLPTEDADRTRLTIYQMHIPLKRLAFRLGFLRGLELADDTRWHERQPAGLWKSALGLA